MKFAYYQIRPAVEHGADTVSFLGPPVSNDYGDGIHTPESALAQAEEYASEVAAERPDKVRPLVFWTLYGMDAENHARAIGDFTTFEAAFEVLVAILMPMSVAADMVANDDGHSADDAAAMLEDICNQSTNDERL